MISAEGDGEIAVALRNLRPTFAVADLDALGQNLDALTRHLGGGVEIMAVVKANAYGHGAVGIARYLEERGVKRFAVALAEEGMVLRQSGIGGEILVLGTIAPEQLDAARAARLTVTVFSLPFLDEIAAAAAVGVREKQDIHLKIDTGMGRLGVQPDEVEAAARRIADSPFLRLTGVYTHFSNADEPDNPKTRRQTESFAAALAPLRVLGLLPPATSYPVSEHLCNSGGALGHPYAVAGLVRLGLALYGVPPFAGIEGIDRVPPLGLVPVLSWHTRIAHIKDVAVGTPLGYGGTFVTARPSRIATLPVGYEDGYNRLFSNQAEVVIAGQRVPVVGRVSMDLTLADVTDVPSAGIGSEVVLLGASGDLRISVWEMARWAQSIPWEIFCRIGPRVPRLYRRGRRVVGLASSFGIVP